MCQQHDFPVGELKGVTMKVWLTHVAMSELGHPVSEAVGEDEASFASHLVLEGKLGARKQTNSYVRVIYGSKTARRGSVKAG
jgi:hypothetical protein